MTGSVPTPAPVPTPRRTAPRLPPHPLLYVVGRYALFQLPELLIVCGALLVGAHYEVIPRMWGWILAGAWVAKEVALFPFVRTAYEPSDPNASSALLGKIAVVTVRLDPTGTVRIGPELWSARLDGELGPIDAGSRVCVKAVEGLTLRVEPVIGG
jgi:membrane protein implicated in regulation of membrane protease activity